MAWVAGDKVVFLRQITEGRLRSVAESRGISLTPGVVASLAMMFTGIAMALLAPVLARVL
ncbi:hypothetical protein [Oceanimonas doudoroffii]|uniref:Uncharacterized protein n=1 Tax=Oceanimonas doudoroffii TaxID=84158 RepID=A0A233RD67_9GAMM|nr:hypothetical protein [Oceanimonas doudoroffii]OXY81320.1 hypothetical protein B6S08_12565 [Oceanimonas doudoroffii]